VLSSGQLIEESLGLFQIENAKVNPIFGKALGILGHAEFFEPLR
jgi:hypothetical protein